MYCDDVDGCFRIRQHTSVFQKSSKMFGDMFGFVRTYDDIPSNDLLKLTGHPRCQTRDDDHTIRIFFISLSLRCEFPHVLFRKPDVATPVAFHQFAVQRLLVYDQILQRADFARFQQGLRLGPAGRRLRRMIRQSREMTLRRVRLLHDTLALTVKDNGNIVLANIQGQSKEFMPATPSGDPSGALTTLL